MESHQLLATGPESAFYFSTNGSAPKYLVLSGAVRPFSAASHVWKKGRFKMAGSGFFFCFVHFLSDELLVKADDILRGPWCRCLE